MPLSGQGRGQLKSRNDFFASHWEDLLEREPIFLRYLNSIIQTALVSLNHWTPLTGSLSAIEDKGLSVYLTVGEIPLLIDTWIYGLLPR